MEVVEKEVKAGGHKLFYRTAGTGNQTIVLLHGIPTNSFLWMSILPELAENFTVIAPDMLGFGKSGRATREELTLPKQAEHLVALLDALDIDSAHIVGHDLGGGVAQIMAVHHPERVNSFVVLDGVAFNNWPLAKVVALRYPTALEFESPAFFIERMFREGLFHQEILAPELLNPFLTPFNHVKGLLELQEASFALDHHQTEDLVPALEQVKLPATFLYGQYDRLLPAYWGHLLKETVPGSTFKVLPECGHFSMLDNPLLVAGEIADHLKRAASS